MANRRNDNKIQSYLRPLPFMLFSAERKMMLRSESEHCAEIIRAHQEKMSENNKQVLLDYYKKNMADEQNIEVEKVK